MSVLCLIVAVASILWPGEPNWSLAAAAGLVAIWIEVRDLRRG
jgi:hypothetical protein